MKRVLVLCGGADYAHDFAATGAALSELVASCGHEVCMESHPDAAADAIATGAVDAMVVNALWWTMGDALYDQWRDEWAYATPQTTKTTIASFVEAGGGIVANHTAPICFDDWPEWGDIVGGSWKWGTSSHPPFGPVTANVVAEHPVTAAAPPVIELNDEVYGGLDLRADTDVLAVAKRTADDIEQPVIWTHHFGAGRVVYDCFGHDAASIRNPQNAAVLAAAVAWVLGES